VQESLCRGRTEIYEELYPETKREATLKQNLPKDGIRLSGKPSFVADTSSKTGKSKRAIEWERAKENKGMRGDIPQKSAKSYKPIDTRKELTSGRKMY
jgi:hypothetical protein